tara:strand:- start:158 stop:319 length:162 start_codon:yes stop_codon:yes gene_type:complete
MLPALNHKGVKMRLIVAFFMALASSLTVAQEMTEMRSEFFYCTLNDGMTMEDV